MLAGGQALRSLPHLHRHKKNEEGKKKEEGKRNSKGGGQEGQERSEARVMKNRSRAILHERNMLKG